jgi:hypothetical protein
MSGENLLDRFIGQLDTLIPFLAISRPDVFRLLRRGGRVWSDVGEQSSLPRTYQVYQKQVCHSAFLLGFSYFEAFLADLVRQIYLRNPRMLPKEKQLKFDEILAAGTYDGVLSTMVAKEVLAIFYKSMDDVSEYFLSKLRLQWPASETKNVVVASHLRNCIVHNNGLADLRLADLTDYKEGAEIALGEADVHQYGISARSLARDLYRQAARRYLETTRRSPARRAHKH